MKTGNRQLSKPRPNRSGYCDYTFDYMSHKLLKLAGEGPLAILVHARPDGDCIGSAFALSSLLGLLGCETRIISADPLPSRLAFIAKDRPELFVHGCPEGGEFGPGAGAVAIDVAAPELLGSLDGKYNVLLGIDHHSGSTQFSDRYLDADSAAAGEIVWRIARSWLRTGVIDDIPTSAAAACYAAVSSDTGCFRYSNVTSSTHRIAAQLIERVPYHAEIDRQLFEIKTPGRIAAEKLASELLKSYCDGKITVCAASYEQISGSGLPTEDLDALVDVARAVDGAEIAFSVRGEMDGSFRVSARSNTDADVSALCSSFGGGGHLRAAGCTLRCESIASAVDMIVSAAGGII
ncbi:MAG: DHHA1 domain-containing protein [Clostridia bacterium]|nr:DHHA1 domain-containing protein [Clostridia bacterium]